MNDFHWFDYVATEYACETCTLPLYRIVPSNLLACINPACASDEPLFLVETP